MGSDTPRSNWFSVALVVVAFFALQLSGVALLKQLIVDDKPAESCTSDHLTAAALEALDPLEATSLTEVYRRAQPCEEGAIGTQEARVTRSYTGSSSAEATARAVMEAAESAGWQRRSPAPGQALEHDPNGTFSVFMGRLVDGHDVRLTATVFSTSRAEPEDREESLAAILESGAPAGVVLRITVQPVSTLPTLDVGRGLFPTPDPGIR